MATPAPSPQFLCLIAPSLFGSCSTTAANDALALATRRVTEEVAAVKWWKELEQLSGATVASFYTCCSATTFKSMERWAYHVGIQVNHIINSGAAVQSSPPSRCLQRLQALAGSAAAAQLPIVLVSPYADLAALEDCLSDSPVKSTLVVANDNVVGAVLSVETLGAVLASRDDAALDAVSLRNAIFEAVASGYIARPSGYTQALESKSEGSERPVMYHLQPSHPEVHARVYARLGLMGNPSDTCGGKTVSATVSNFWADVWLTASTSISFKPHPLYDPHEFGSLRELAFTTGRDGYSGAQRLFLATLRKLFVMAEAAGIDLPAKGFKVHFDTNIPRQVGLAGSSALITAFIKCLFRYWKLSKEQLEALGISKQSLPSLVLAVELQELNISAGLQDRVIQVYQGIVHMDFSPELMKGVSYGRYTELDPRPLPPLFLAYTLYPSDSGRIHAPIKQRWEQKDAEIVEGMQQVAGLADEFKALLESKASEAERAHSLAVMMNKNFSLRRSMYGDSALGEKNLAMIELGKKLGVGVKFPGSGGAVVGCIDLVGMKEAGADVTLPSDGTLPSQQVAAAFNTIRKGYEALGCVCVRLVIEPAVSGTEDLPL